MDIAKVDEIWKKAKRNFTEDQKKLAKRLESIQPGVMVSLKRLTKLSRGVFQFYLLDSELINAEEGNIVIATNLTDVNEKPMLNFPSLERGIRIEIDKHDKKLRLFGNRYGTDGDKLLDICDSPVMLTTLLAEKINENIPYRVNQTIQQSLRDKNPAP